MCLMNLEGRQNELWSRCVTIHKFILSSSKNVYLEMYFVQESKLQYVFCELKNVL